MVSLVREAGLLCVLEDGRAIRFSTSQTMPQTNGIMRLWYSDSDFTGESTRFSLSFKAKTTADSKKLKLALKLFLFGIPNSSRNS